MKTYNYMDKVIVQVAKNILYHAQVKSDDGRFVQVILKEKIGGNRDFMYDAEYGITHNMVVEKLYDAATDKVL